MPSFGLLRVAALLAVPATRSLLGSEAGWLVLVFAIGFGHYALSYIYASKQIGEVFRHKSTVLSTGLLVAFGLSLWMADLPLVLFFLPHHVFNEVYLTSRALGTPEGPAAGRWRLCSVILHSLLYIAILLPYDPYFSTKQHLFPPTILFATLALAYIAFFVVLWRVRSDWTPRRLADACSFEVLAGSALALPWIFGITVDFVDVVFYHFAFWALWPVKGMLAKSPRAAGNYVALTIALTAFFIFISPRGMVRYELFGSWYGDQFILWSYIHISTAFALSNAFPAWIVRMFRPPAKQAAHNA